MNSKSLAEIRANCKGFALIDHLDIRFISPLWQSIALLIQSIPPTGATTDQIVDRTGLNLNTVHGFLRALRAGGFPIRAEKQPTRESPLVFFVQREDVRWLWD